MVAVTDSLLRAAPHDQALLHTRQRPVQSVLDGSAAGIWRRNTPVQALWAPVSFVATTLSQGQTLSEVMEPVVAALSYEEDRYPLLKAREMLGLAVPSQAKGDVCLLPIVNTHICPYFDAAKVEK